MSVRSVKNKRYKGGVFTADLSLPASLLDEDMIERIIESTIKIRREYIYFSIIFIIAAVVIAWFGFIGFPIEDDKINLKIAGLSFTGSLSGFCVFCAWRTLIRSRSNINIK